MVDKSYVLLTTSRRPSGKTRAFCKDLSNAFPNMSRINRGKLSIDGIAEKALEFDAEKVMIVSSRRGKPGKVQLFEINEEGLRVFPPSLYLKDVRLRRDMEQHLAKGRKTSSIAVTASEDSPPEIRRFEEALSQFLNIPTVSFKQAYSGRFDTAMEIRHHSPDCIIVTFKLLPKLVEVGPQIKLSHLVWEFDE